MAEDISTPEQWRPVVGYEGLYEVSDQGRVRSLGRYIRHPKTPSGVVWRPGQMLPGSPHERGHLYVQFCDGDGGQSWRTIHRLVLFAFVGPPPQGKPNGLHWNDKPDDNALTNLYWGSHSENSHDAVRNGNHTQARKVACPLDHLLVDPNLVPSSTRQGGRGCLACKMTQSARTYEARLIARGRERTRYNRGKDGFIRRAGETFHEEADRRYRHILSQGA
ncbi:NUMOD4 domain-containing protein [Pseudonocardia parietis]|uniref:NUMOD4 domain-containing protein n=1 Tax=Pseudonocardia parietis TaxID=570936 RepID=A0ABS4W3E6_9PSEU|nr:NUMOD4 domain-containing protein [Pseudonocardia parietis]MBP2370209.1 hypothetical protein [Pseudonocardia parietis]